MIGEVQVEDGVVQAEGAVQAESAVQAEGAVQAESDVARAGKPTHLMERPSLVLIYGGVRFDLSRIFSKIYIYFSTQGAKYIMMSAGIIL